MTKGLTTNYLICKTYILKAGETVLFHAAAGGVGQIFAQWANSIGAKVIGTVGSDEKIKIAEENGYAHVINYTKDDFAKKVMEITNNEGVPAVFDGVGKNTFKGSLACLKTRGMMVSFGNASGPLDPVNVPKDIQPKGLYLTRPSIGQYFTNRKELQAGADAVFEKVKFGKIKIKISKEYNLIDAKQAHEDLEARKLNWSCYSNSLMNNKVISPCISICRTDPITGYCYGCARTNEEKKLWKNDNTENQWKEENLKLIISRMQGWQLETFKESYNHKKIKEYLYLKKTY